MGNQQPPSPSKPGNTSDERGNYTQRKVAEYWNKYGGKYNVMCILAGNSYNIDKLKGMQEKEVSFNNVLSHSSNPSSLPQSPYICYCYITSFQEIYIAGYKYMIYVFHSGLFINYDDGGYINWAFQGKFTRNGGSVYFQAH